MLSDLLFSPYARSLRPSLYLSFPLEHIFLFDLRRRLLPSILFSDHGALDIGVVESST